MTVKEMMEKLPLTLEAGKEGIDRPVKGAYICDLLSWVMGRAEEDAAWITIQGHINIVAVALLTGVSCIIVAEGAELDANMLEKAESEGIPVLRTQLPSYEVGVLLSKELERA